MSVCLPVRLSACQGTLTATLIVTKLGQQMPHNKCLKVILPHLRLRLF